jgi:hypothetical protein
MTKMLGMAGMDGFDGRLNDAAIANRDFKLTHYRSSRFVAAGAVSGILIVGLEPRYPPNPLPAR